MPDLPHDQTVEIKARCSNLGRARELISGWGAKLLGRENQTDTFYNVPDGRLKLRVSSVEKLLIGYHRPDQAGPKHCLVDLYPTEHPKRLHEALSNRLGVRVVVRKDRERWLLGNVKFHLDRVDGLGDFIEIEILGKRGVDSVESLREVCDDYMRKLGILEDDLVEVAYADLLDSGGESA
jgi:predicted adenylyl cyclase CyaB